MRFVDTGYRTDVFFDKDETPFDIAATVLSLCAYPKQSDQGKDGRANRFWEAIYFVAAKRGRSLHPISGVPPRQPNRRSAMAQLERGFSNLHRLMQLHVAVAFSSAGGGALSFSASRDLSKITISIALDELGRMKSISHPAPPSLSEVIQYHQPIIGLGNSDELGTGETETAKTLSKRFLRPMLRVDHVLGPLWSEILTHHNPAEHRDWAARLIKSDPAWVLRIIEQSRTMAPYKAQLARQRGMRTASVDRMVHFHLPKHVQLLPPTVPLAGRH